MLHKLRSFLTMLGTILGVGSVIAMLAIGEGSKRKAVEQIRQLGATNVIIRSVKPEPDNEGEESSSGAIATADQSRLGVRTEVSGLRTTAGHVADGHPFAAHLAVAQRCSTWSPPDLQRADPGHHTAILKVKNLDLHRGRFLTDTDLKKTANVCVLAAGCGPAIVRLRGPAGQRPVARLQCLPRGGRAAAAVERQRTAGGTGQANFNNDIYIPITAARSRFGELQMIVRAGSMEFERTQLSEITLTVETRQWSARPRRWRARSWKDRTHVATTTKSRSLWNCCGRRSRRSGSGTWSWVPSPASRLLVGGIGIMNIMLATVTERTREIGIRRALGARRRDITSQFLVETTVLSSTGGLLGIVVGIVIPMVVTRASEIETVLSWWAVLLAFGISVATGIMFGMYPARRAAMMDPIEALRHE